MLSPDKAMEKAIESGVKKANLKWWKMLAFGIFAGMFIALAAIGSIIGGFYGGKIIGALIFPIGLAMVVIAGSELFTGNNLMVMALFDGKIGIKKLLKNWGLVFLGNLIGALIVALIAGVSGALDVVAENVVMIAKTKVEMGFGEAMLKGVLCNFLVCIAVWMAFFAETMSGKIVAVFLPVMLFVLCGFEHSVANMFYVPAGMVMGDFAGMAAPSISEFLVLNLLPVTLGNIIGGAFMVGGGYYLLNKK